LSSRNTRTVLLIAGMCDNGSREQIAEALGRVNGVKQVDVTLFRAKAIVIHDPHCEPVELVRAVAGTGHRGVVQSKRGKRGVGEAGDGHAAP